MSNSLEGQMVADIATLKVQVKHLTDLLHEQKRAMEKQDVVLAKLTELAAQGKGSLWMLIAIGGVVGAIVTNISAIASFISNR